MRPCHGVCLVLIALVTLALGQEESDEDLVYDDGELEYDEGELDYYEEELTYDTMLAEVSCSIHFTAHRIGLILQGSRKGKPKPTKGKCATKGPKLNAQNTKVEKTNITI